MGGFLAGLREAIVGQEIIPVTVQPERKSTTFETVNPSPLITVTSSGEEITINLQELFGATPAQMYRSQPYLRAVIDFLARNIAQLGLHCYERVSDTERMRTTSAAIARLIKSPNAHTTRYELLNALVSDLALWDEAFWLLTPDSKSSSGFRITAVPVLWVDRPIGGDYWEPDSWRITRPGQRTEIVAAANVIHFHGWDPDYAHSGVSPVQTLKHILYEQIAAVVYRQQRWERGGRVGHVITRPATAPVWSNDAEERFRREWRNSYTGTSGTDAGGTPILQDGMTLSKVGFTSVEDEFVEASKLALTTVAAVYHVNPTMVGLLDNANYSNVREFRRMLYGDTLGPWLSMIEDRVNGFVVPRVEGDSSQIYVEFNIAEKLQGSFEEQATVASMAVGGPYMTRNEYRLRQNMPPIDGGDELIVPLNVTAGGQPSPVAPLSMPMRQARPVRRSRTIRTTRSSSIESKLKASQKQQERTAAVLRKFYRHQSEVVLTALGRKSDDEFWDEDRWNDELADDLTAVALIVSADIGDQAMSDLGVQQSYDVKRTKTYLSNSMRWQAESINATTKEQLDAALEADDEDDEDDEDARSPADVFDEAENERSLTGAVTLCTTIAGIAMSEAGRQAAPDSATKTWIVNNPNSRHPEMDGETVGIDDQFSNGAKWPGDAALGSDETAGCQCELEISIP